MNELSTCCDEESYNLHGSEIVYVPKKALVQGIVGGVGKTPEVHEVNVSGPTGHIDSQMTRT